MAIPAYNDYGQPGIPFMRAYGCDQLKTIDVGKVQIGYYGSELDRGCCEQFESIASI